MEVLQELEVLLDSELLNELAKKLSKELSYVGAARA